MPHGGQHNQPVPFQKDIIPIPGGGLAATGAAAGAFLGGVPGSILGAGSGFLLDTVISGFQADNEKRAVSMQLAAARRLNRKEQLLQQQKFGEGVRQFNLRLGLDRETNAFNQQQTLKAAKVNKFQRLQNAIFETIQKRGALRQQFIGMGVV